MIKSSLLFAAFLLLILNVKAQNDAKKSSLILAVNAEQMLNKAGFDNLLDAIFNDKDGAFSENDVNKVKIRKSIAAIYGAGIDFDKKIWFVANAKDNEGTGYGYIYNPFKNLDAAIYIPIANKQVVEKAISDMRSGSPIQWQEKYGTKYIAEENFVIALNDKVMACFFNANRIGDYGSYKRYRIVIKTDTIKSKDYNTTKYEDDFGKEKADPNFIVDKVDAQGNVTREEKYSKKTLMANLKNYDYDRTEVRTIKADTAMSYRVTEASATAKKSKRSQPPSKKAKTAKGEVVMVTDEEVKGAYDVKDVSVPAPPSVYSKAEVASAEIKEVTRETSTTAAPAIASKDWYNKDYAKKNKNRRDTLTDYDYLPNNTRIEIKYFDCSQKERDSIDLVIEKEKITSKEAFVEEKLLSLKGEMLFDPTTDNNIKLIQESRSDIYMYNSGKAFNYMNTIYGAGVIAAANVTTPGMDNSSFASTLDFEPGKIVMQANTYYDAQLLKLFSNFYYPLNNNWPANFGSKSKGQMQVNVNINKVLDYYEGIFSNYGGINVFKKLEEKGFKADEISQAFTGEMYGFIDTKNSKREYKKEKNREDMLGGMAIGVKDAKAAVSLLNKVASMNNEMPQYYAFDKTGKYLVFFGSMDNKSFAEDMANIIDSKIVDKEMISLSGNDFGKVQLNLKGLILAMSGDEINESKTLKYFVDRTNMITFGMNRIEDGNYKTIFTMDCGETKQNPLAMFIEMTKIQKQEDAIREEKYRLEREEREKKDAIKRKTTIKKPTRRITKK